MDIFSIISAGNLLSSVAGGSGDVFKDIFGKDNPISTTKDKAVDMLSFFTEGARTEAKMPGEGPGKDGGDGFNFTFGSGSSTLDDFLKPSSKLPTPAIKALSSSEITQQLLSGTFDITKL